MKVIIIGASTTGKTTIIKHLAEELSFPIQESDDVLTSLNGGTYPLDSRLKREVLTPTMVNLVLNQQEIIFFTNAHYFNVANLVTAKKSGFKIILLTLTKEKMLSRNEKRIKDEGYDDLEQYFDNMLLYQQEIIKAGMVDEVIDVDKSLVEVLAQIKQIVGNI